MGRTFHVRHTRMKNERRYVDLVNCLLTGKASQSMKTELLTAL